MAHTYTNLLTHIIFSTKDRKPTLEPDLKRRLFPYLGGIFRELDASPLLVNGPTDHVHILVVLPAKLAPAEIIGTVKANSGTLSLNGGGLSTGSFVAAAPRLEKIRDFAGA